MRRIALLLLFCCVTGCSSCTNLFFFPLKEYRLTPKNLGLRYEEVDFPSADSSKLHGWLLNAEGIPQGTVVFLHGNAENISTHIASIYWLPKEGFNVFLFDYRGYGASEGRLDIDGVHQDAESALRWVFDNEKIDSSRVVVFGQSIGGAIALETVHRSTFRNRIRALIVEAAFFKLPKNC